MSNFGIWCFLWLIIGCAIGFGAGVLYLFLLGSSPETHERPRISSLPLVLMVIRGAWSLVALVAAAGMSYGLKLDKTAAVLLLVAVVLLIAKLAAPAYGMAASLVAVVLLDFLFLPPIGSVRVSDPGDRLTLLLFLVTAVAGSRLVGGRRGPRIIA